MELSGQLHASAALMPGKQPDTRYLGVSRAVLILIEKRKITGIKFVRNLK
jgi:hypothetical protein